MLERDDALTWLSLRNVASVHLLAVDQLNTYDVLLSDDVVFTKGAYDAFVNGTASATARKATIVEAPGTDATVEAEPPRPTTRSSPPRRRRAEDETTTRPQTTGGRAEEEAK